MPKYLAQVTYTSEGQKGLIKDGGAKRREVVEKMIISLGGKMEAFYYAFGEKDLFVIADMPDNVSMSAVALTVNATGTVNCQTTVLLTAEELDEAAKKTPFYTQPGK